MTSLDVGPLWWAWDCADKPTRYMMDLVSRGAVSASFAYGLALPIDALWVLTYPVSYEWRREQVMGVLDIALSTITIDGVEFSIYRTFKPWGLRLKNDLIHYPKSLDMPYPERFTIGGIAPPGTPL